MTRARTRPPRPPSGAACALLAGAIAFAACAGGAYRHPHFAELRPAIRTVAMVPFEFGASAADTFTVRFVTGAVRRAAHLSLSDAHARGRFTTALQPIARTDSLLAAAGIEAGGVSRRTHVELGRILDVDAVLRGSITEFYDPGLGDRIAAAALGPALSGSRGSVHTEFAVFDTRSGDLICRMIEAASAGFLRDGSAALGNVGHGLANAFPFER